MLKSLSVFFPAYNEEGNLPTTIKQAVSLLQKQSFLWEIIIIDDGSTDKTAEIANAFARKNKRIKVTHQVNGGYGLALRAGFAKAKYDWIAYMDSDGQFDFAEIERFFKSLDQADAFWGYRIERKDSLARFLIARLWTLSLFLAFGLRLRDVNCGFKLIKRSVLEQLPALKSTRGGMINAELAIKIKRSGFKIIEIPLTHYPRLKGHPTGIDLNVALKSYWELLRLRLNFA